LEENSLWALRAVQPKKLNIQFSMGSDCTATAQAVKTNAAAATICASGQKAR